MSEYMASESKVCGFFFYSLINTTLLFLTLLLVWSRWDQPLIFFSPYCDCRSGASGEHVHSAHIHVFRYVAQLSLSHWSVC